MITVKGGYGFQGYPSDSFYKHSLWKHGLSDDYDSYLAIVTRTYYILKREFSEELLCTCKITDSRNLEHLYSKPSVSNETDYTGIGTGGKEVTPFPSLSSLSLISSDLTVGYTCDLSLVTHRPLTLPRLCDRLGGST